MADTPQFKRGAGGDPANPPAGYGDATALNEALPSNPTGQSPDTPQEPIPGVTGRPETPVSSPRIENDRHKLLFAPTDRPNEDVLHGMHPNGRLAPPPDLVEWLPDLQDAAKQPDVSPAVRMLYDAISQQLG